jgi:hypothetical protein
MISIDTNGRLVPATSEFVYSQVDRRYFFLDQPSLDLGGIFTRFKRHFMDKISITEVEFKDQIDSLVQNLSVDATNKDLLCGVYVPFVIPAHLSQMDLGEAFADLVNLVEESFTSEFQKYEFHDYSDKNYLKNMQIVPTSRIEETYKKLESGDLVGLYFPAALAGYAISSQRDAIERLDTKFALSGPLEVACAFIGSPSLLMKSGENYPNGLVIAGVESVTTSQKNYFWYFEAYGFNLNVNCRSMVGPASEYFSGGLTLVN